MFYIYSNIDYAQPHDNAKENKEHQTEIFLFHDINFRQIFT